MHLRWCFCSSILKQIWGIKLSGLSAPRRALLTNIARWTRTWFRALHLNLACCLIFCFLQIWCTCAPDLIGEVHRSSQKEANQTCLSCSCIVLTLLWCFWCTEAPHIYIHIYIYGTKWQLRTHDDEEGRNFRKVRSQPCFSGRHWARVWLPPLRWRPHEAPCYCIVLIFVFWHVYITW